jgi:hypothetical protein
MLRGLFNRLLGPAPRAPAGAPGPPLLVGGLYSIVQGSAGSFRVMKLLVAEGEVVHVRVYKQSFKERPAQVDAASLTLGGISDEDGFGIGHLPLSAGAFNRWQPVLIQQSTVEEEELEGYREWKAAGGGVF